MAHFLKSMCYIQSQSRALLSTFERRALSAYDKVRIQKEGYNLQRPLSACPFSNDSIRWQRRYLIRLDTFYKFL